MERLKFAMFSDLHMDIMHDGDRRLRAFLDAARQEGAEFIVHLGDFCYPEDTTRCECSRENMPVNLKNAMRVPAEVPKLEMLRLFNSFERPSYHVLGNHEFDFASKEKTMELYGMRNNYYSFQAGGWRFIVLDSNHYRGRDGMIRNYWYGDYFDSRDLPYLDDAQLHWLEELLLGAPQPTILFSHQPLNETCRGLRNAQKLRELIAHANSPRQTVFLCANGHTHVDRLEEVDGVYYYTLNSISNHWLGDEHPCRRYPDEIEAKFPNLQYVLPYADPVFAIIELTESGAYIKGRQGRFVPPGPEELGLGGGLSASVQDRFLPWNI